MGGAGSWYKPGGTWSSAELAKDIRECEYDAERARMSANWRMQNTLEIRDETMRACMRARGYAPGV
jgi:hypothetical protein